MSVTKKCQGRDTLGKGNTPCSALWRIPLLTTVSSVLLHFFYVVVNWQWISVIRGGTPSVAIGSKCFPWLWRDVKARHVTLDDVLVAQFGSASSTWRCIQFSVKDITLPSQRRYRCLMMVMRSYEQCRRQPKIFGEPYILLQARNSISFGRPPLEAQNDKICKNLEDMILCPPGYAYAYETVICMTVEVGTLSLHEAPKMERRRVK